MEKGHFGGYTGNARHSRKEEMIHDRELIYDAKKQLHNADKDYKSDSPAHRALVGNQDRLPGIVKKAISDAPAQMNADLAYDPVNDRADSPMSMYGKKEGSPAKNSGLGPKKAGSALNMVFSTPVRGATGGGSDGTEEDMGNHPDDRKIAGGVTPTTPTPSTVPPATKTESFGVASGTSRGADRRKRILGKAERKASVSTGKTKARLERKADRIKRRQTIKGDGLQSKPTVKQSGGGKSKNSGGSGGSGGSSAKGGSGGSSGNNINTQNVNVYR